MEKGEGVYSKYILGDFSETLFLTVSLWFIPYIEPLSVPDFVVQCGRVQRGSRSELMAYVRRNCRWELGLGRYGGLWGRDRCLSLRSGVPQ